MTHSAPPNHGNRPDARMTRAELAALVGSPRRSKILKWIEERRWKHDVDVHGWPVVLWSEAQAQLNSRQRTAPDYEVDVEAIRKAG